MQTIIEMVNAEVKQTHLLVKAAGLANIMRRIVRVVGGRRAKQLRGLNFTGSKMDYGINAHYNRIGNKLKPMMPSNIGRAGWTGQLANPAGINNKMNLRVIKGLAPQPRKLNIILGEAVQ